MALIHNDGKTIIHDFNPGAAVVTDSEWLFALRYSELVASVEALTVGDVVQLRGHGGDPDISPDPADIGFQIGVDITADGALQSTVLPTFVKLIKSANVGGGATTAELLLRKDNL